MNTLADGNQAATQSSGDNRGSEALKSNSQIVSPPSPERAQHETIEDRLIADVVNAFETGRLTRLDGSPANQPAISEPTQEQTTDDKSRPTP